MCFVCPLRERKNTQDPKTKREYVRSPMQAGKAATGQAGRAGRQAGRRKASARRPCRFLPSGYLSLCFSRTITRPGAPQTKTLLSTITARRTGFPSAFLSPAFLAQRIATKLTYRVSWRHLSAVLWEKVPGHQALCGLHIQQRTAIEARPPYFRQQPLVSITACTPRAAWY